MNLLKIFAFCIIENNVGNSIYVANIDCKLNNAL